jgi:cytochrome c2
VRTGKPHAGYQLPLTPEQFYEAGVAATEAACSKRSGANFEDHGERRAPCGVRRLRRLHTSDGTNGLGPSIKGVYGRKAGTARGFTYSPAMKKADVIWDEKTLAAFITRSSAPRSLPT